MLAYLGVLNGAAVMMVGIATGLGWVHACPACNDGCSGDIPVGCDTSCCYCHITDVIIPIYTCFLGGILVIAELRLPIVNACCKDNFGFMFSLTFRVLYLLFIGSFGFAIKCQRYKYYVGWAAGIFSFGNAFLSCLVMNKHPGFVHLSGHEAYAETADSAPFGGNKLTKKIDSVPVATIVESTPSGGGSGGNFGWGEVSSSGYSPPGQQPQPQEIPASAFGSIDPHASSKATETARNGGGGGAAGGSAREFDANPFA